MLTHGNFVNCTFDHANTVILMTSGCGTRSVTFNFYNSILAYNTTLLSGCASIAGDHNGFAGNGFNPFGTQSATSTAPFVTPARRGGAYYLAEHTFKNAGKTTIDGALLAALRRRTTDPPDVYETLPVPLTLSPKAQRDPGLTYVALGYHYPPLDAVFGHCTAYGNVTVAAGTAVGWFRTGTGIEGSGITLGGNSILLNGTQSSPVRWVRLNTVQESDTSGRNNSGGLYASSSPAIIDARFTIFSMMAGDEQHLSGMDGAVLRVVHSEFHGSGIGGWQSIELNCNNCLFDCAGAQQLGSYPSRDISARMVYFGEQERP